MKSRIISILLVSILTVPTFAESNASISAEEMYEKIWEAMTVFHENDTKYIAKCYPGQSSLRKERAAKSLFEAGKRESVFLKGGECTDKDREIFYEYYAKFCEVAKCMVSKSTCDYDVDFRTCSNQVSYSDLYSNLSQSCQEAGREIEGQYNRQEEL